MAPISIDRTPKPKHGRESASGSRHFVDLGAARLLPADEAGDCFVGDGDIGPYRPNRMTDKVAGVSRQIAFNRMTRNQCRIRQGKQHSASLRPTEYRNKGGNGCPIVSDYRAPPIEWDEMVSPVLGCEFLVRRNHP
jgi:hypothetical protein